MGTLIFVAALIAAGALVPMAYTGTGTGRRLQVGRLAPAALVVVLGFGLESLLVEVPGSETGVVTLFGQYTQRTLGPGLNVKLPWEGVIVVNTSVQALKQEKSDAFTSDKQHAYTDYTVNFALRPSAAPDVLRNYQGDIENRIIEPRVEFWLKDIEPKYSATDLINNRVGVAQAVQKHLEDDLRDRGVDVVGVYITNISFGDAYQHASEALAAAQQDLQHERIELQIRQVKAQQVVADAQGQASANKLIRDSLPQNPQEADAIVRLRLVNLLETKWNGTMPQSLGGGSLLSVGETGSSGK